MVGGAAGTHIFAPCIGESMMLTTQAPSSGPLLRLYPGRRGGLPGIDGISSSSRHRVGSDASHEIPSEPTADLPNGICRRLIPRGGNGHSSDNPRQSTSPGHCDAHSHNGHNRCCVPKQLGVPPSPSRGGILRSTGYNSPPIDNWPAPSPPLSPSRIRRISSNTHYSSPCTGLSADGCIRALSTYHSPI
jgi:hypothetical protein